MQIRLLSAGVAALSLGVALALAAPSVNFPNKPNDTQKSDGTIRKTAPPWTGSLDIFETPGREANLQLPRVFRDLKIGSGSKVADIGAGGGWLTVRLAAKVGPKGTVYAQEILPRYLNAIEQRAKRANLSNIRTILGTTSNPNLPAKTLDAAIILNAYHEFDQPLAMLAKIRGSMKPGARLGIMERDNDDLRREARQTYSQTGQILRRISEKDDKNPTTDDHRLALDIVRREGEKAGFKFLSSRELGEDHYLAVFVVP